MIDPLSMSIADISADMRIREAEYDHAIPDDRWIIVRLDGRGFSSLTEQHFTKPFDGDFRALMLCTAQEILALLEGAYCYTGSDEISLVLSPKWSMFGRRISKIISISASIAASTFTQYFKNKGVQFDSRVIAFSSIDEVIQYCCWRIADVRRCALHTLAYWTLRNQDMSAKKAAKILDGMPFQEKDKMLQEKYAVNFRDIPLWEQQGDGIYWKSYKKVGYDPIQNKEVIADRRRVAVIDVGLGDQHKAWLYDVLQKDSIKE